jgi:hypothetical protein
MFREAHAVWKDGPYSGKGTSEADIAGCTNRSLSMAGLKVAAVTAV